MLEMEYKSSPTANDAASYSKRCRSDPTAEEAKANKSTRRGSIRAACLALETKQNAQPKNAPKLNAMKKMLLISRTHLRP